MILPNKMLPSDSSHNGTQSSVMGDNQGSLIISSQLPVSAWYGCLGEQTVVDAIRVRIVHNAIPVELEAESMLKIQGKRKEENGPMTHGPELR